MVHNTGPVGKFITETASTALEHSHATTHPMMAAVNPDIHSTGSLNQEISKMSYAWDASAQLGPWTAEM